MAEVVRQRKLGNIRRRIVKFFTEIKAELKKVIWPTWKQLVNNTVTVLLTCLVIGMIIWLADFGLNELLKLTLPD